jgi:hypothetical protein
VKYGATGSGIVDDSDAIQAVIDMAPEGAEVFLPKGIYNLGTPHGPGNMGNFPSGQPIKTAIYVTHKNITIAGVGPETVLILMPNTKMRVISIPTSSQSVTISNLVVDGNKTNRVGAPWPGGDVVDAMVYGWLAVNVKIVNLETRNGIEDGIGCWQCIGDSIENTHSHDNGTTEADAAGISFSGSNGSFSNNKIENNRSAGIWSAFGTNGVRITNNIISNNVGAALAIGGQGGVDQNYIIRNNIIQGNGFIGRFPAIAIVTANNGLIENNYIINNLAAITVYSGDSWQVMNNTCIQNGSGQSTMPSDADSERCQ